MTSVSWWYKEGLGGVLFIAQVDQAAPSYGEQLEELKIISLHLHFFSISLKASGNNQGSEICRTKIQNKMEWENSSGVHLPLGCCFAPAACRDNAEGCAELPVVL